MNRILLKSATIAQFLAYMLASSVSAHAGTPLPNGNFTYSDARKCVAEGRLPAEICAFAEANAAAEFEEKAPRFATRSACEQAYGPGGCSLGFRGAEGWAGKKNSLFFSPRQKGFRVTVKSEHDATVVPLGSDLVFSTRSALRRDASINPRARRDEPTSPSVQHGPPPPMDPNFDCSAYLDPSDKGDPRTGCAPVSAPRR